MTTVPLIRPREVVAPDVERLQGTLYDVSPPRDDYKWVDPTSILSTLNCLATRSTDPTCGSPQTKTFDFPSWVNGARFAAYGGVKCMGVGGNAEMVQEAVQVWERVESRAVEQGLVENVLSETVAGTNKTPTPGTAVSPSLGLAILEEWAAERYAGVATLHIPRGVAQSLSQNGAIDTGSTPWRTNVRTKVSAGGGYGLVNKGPNNAAAGAGEYWMWVTGEVVIYRSGVVSQNELHRTNNENIILVERAFITAVDCLVAAVLVKVS